MEIMGQKLRAIRQEHGLSLRALAEKANVSISLLSQIENGKSMPSVKTLHNIADALDVPLGQFFPNPDEPLVDETANGNYSGGNEPSAQKLVLRRENRPKLVLNGGVEWMNLTPRENKDAQFLELHYPVGASSNATMSHHNGREFGLVLSGELTVEFDGDALVLGEGDSIIFDSTQPHRLVNEGVVPVVAIWVVLNTCPAS